MNVPTDLLQRLPLYLFPRFKNVSQFELETLVRLAWIEGYADALHNELDSLKVTFDALQKVTIDALQKVTIDGELHT